MLLMAPDLTGWPQPTQGATERILDTIQLKVYASSDLRYHVESAMPGWTAHSTAVTNTHAMLAMMLCNSGVELQPGAATVVITNLATLTAAA